MAGADRGAAAKRLEDRPASSADALDAARGGSGRERVEAYLDVFCTDKRASRATASSPSRSPRTIPQWAERLRARAGRASARCVAKRTRRARARPQRGAAHRRRRRDRALPRREGPARPARLRRPDRQDAGAAPRPSRRLGALQARPRHRPRADRRGAGHEPQAMGDHPRAWSPSSCRRRRAQNVRRTMFAVGDEKQSIFSFQGAAPRAFAEMRDAFRAGCTRRATRRSRSTKLDHSFRSGAERAARGRQGVRRAGGVSRADRRRRRGRVHQALPDAAPGRGGNLGR